MSGWNDAAVNAAELLDDLEKTYEGEIVEIGEVMVIVEITGEADTEEQWTGVFFRCSNPKRWIQAGMLTAAIRAAWKSGEIDEED